MKMILSTELNVPWEFLSLGKKICSSHLIHPDGRTLLTKVLLTADVSEVPGMIENLKNLGVHPGRPLLHASVGQIGFIMS